MPPIRVKDLNIPEKLILYTVSQVEGGLKTETHLQKLLFLTSKALGIKPERLGFYPYDYGPFSLMIKEIGESLVEKGFFSKKGTGVAVDPSIINQIDDAKPKDELDQFKIKEMGEFISGLTREEVILHTYVRDQEFAKKSKILDDVLTNRVPVAIGMVKKGKISSTAGAELAGVPIINFLEMIRMGAQVVD